MVCNMAASNSDNDKEITLFISCTCTLHTFSTSTSLKSNSRLHGCLQLCLSGDDFGDDEDCGAFT